MVGLKAYKEVDERMEQLWHNIDAAVVTPRMDADRDSLPSVHADSETLGLSGQAETSVSALLQDLETLFVFLAQKLPSDLLHSLSNFMMPDVIPRLIRAWLTSAVPSGLKDMGFFQDMVQRARRFCEALDSSGYTGHDELREWVDKAPTNWLSKCRETTLDAVRTKLRNGVGESKQVEKVEKQMVSWSEGKELSKTGAGAHAENDWGDDWGDAWDEEPEQSVRETGSKADQPEATVGGDDDGADAWGWDDAADQPKEDSKADDEDGAAAWGWGNEDGTTDPEPAPGSKAKATASHQTRELILRETYNISSMPEPVLELIFAILEDGAVLTQEGTEYAPVAATSPGLFGLPTFALALFRAISPYYYSFDVGGNM